MSTPEMIEDEDGVRLHVAEVDAVFGHDWVCVGHVAMLPKPGDYFVVDLIGNPLVVVRGDDRIRVLSRVCLHRWALVIEGAGNVRRFTCPFHAWTYGLDGQLLGAAFMDEAEGFVRSQQRLPEARTEIVEETGLIFVNLANGAGAGHLPQALFEAGLAEAVVAGPFQERAAPMNWKHVLEERLAASNPVYSRLPNLLVSLKDGIANLTLLYPNGPHATLVRTVVLRGVTGGAVADPPTTRLSDYLRERAPKNA